MVMHLSSEPDESRAGKPVNMNSAVPYAQQFTGKVISNRYRLDILCADTASKKVFSAIDETNGDKVALKLVDLKRAEPTAIEQLQASLEDALRLDNENLVRLISYELRPTAAVLIFEYIEGITIRQALQAQKKLPETAVIEILSGICAGLHALHLRGKTHANLNPDHILLADGKTQRPVLIGHLPLANLQPADDGQSEANEPAGQTAAARANGRPWGSADVRYASPERIVGKPLDARSDIYALSCILYESLCGVPPFGPSCAVEDDSNRLDAENITAQHLKEIPPRFREQHAELQVSSHIERAIMEGLAKSREGRPRDADYSFNLSTHIH